MLTTATLALSLTHLPQLLFCTLRQPPEPHFLRLCNAYHKIFWRHHSKTSHSHFAVPRPHPPHPHFVLPLQYLITVLFFSLSLEQVPLSLSCISATPIRSTFRYTSAILAEVEQSQSHSPYLSMTYHSHFPCVCATPTRCKSSFILYGANHSPFPSIFGTPTRSTLTSTSTILDRLIFRLPHLPPTRP